MSEDKAMAQAVELARKTGKTVYVIGHGNMCQVSDKPGTMCCTRVLPA